MNRLIALIIILLISFSLYSQTIQLNCVNKPLNELLIEWRKQYNLQFSFNDELLSQYLINKTQSFGSPDKAIQEVIKNLPLACEKHNMVYIIFAIDVQDKNRVYHLTGKIIEQGTNEPLPFSHVLANDLRTITDIKGIFTFSSKSDSIFHVKASHLGCYVIDTLLTAGNQHTLTLTPSYVGLPEIKVFNNIVEKSAQVGEQSGLIKLNHYIANYLPGNGDNSVFDLLKLQPGITAAGENANDLILWGSSEGTSMVQFDGYTIWGLKNLNDNISSVNPFMVKTINVYKGGYDATQNDFIGGIVDINGINGNRNKPAFHFFLNNQTINSLLELPVGKKSSLAAAYRQNYYDLISASDIQLKEVTSIERYQWSYEQPDYNFRDINLKYSLQGNNGDLFYISLLGGGDQLQVDAKQDSIIRRIEKLNIEDNTYQIGASAYYGKTFKQGNSSSILVSFSQLHADYEISSLREFPNTTIERYNRKANNTILEITSNWQNHIKLTPNNQLTAGLCFIQNNTIITEEVNHSANIDLISHSSRLALYAQNQYNIHRELALTTGFRFSYPTHTHDFYFDPRLSLSYKPGLFKMNIAWGLYHQFIARTSIVDENNRIRYAWYVSGYNDVPVLKSEHLVLGLAYSRNNLLLSIDSYYKRNKNLTRYIRSAQGGSISDGLSKSYGLDIFTKKDFNGHSVWASYSLSKTEELYDYFRPSSYRRSPQDQRHEFKIAGLLNLNSFHLSASYIYGSGFPLFTNIIKYQYTEPDYNRTDLSIIYRIKRGIVNGEIGLSILNIFDNNNVKYNSFQLIPVDEFNSVLVNQEAMPLTPLLHLKLNF